MSLKIGSAWHFYNIYHQKHKLLQGLTQTTTFGFLNIMNEGTLWRLQMKI